MTEKAVFHLFIPSLTQKLNSWFRDFSVEIDTPYLSTLLLEFDKKYQEGSHTLENAFFTFLDSEVKELPVAYYRNQTHNKNTYERIICADPVHLEVGMNDVTLTKKITDLSDAEAKELILVLNTHFKDDGLTFLFGSNQSWYVLYDKDETIYSHDLDSMLMGNVIGKQATSVQRNWQVVQNETQMLLHSSDINQQREIAGLDSVNSLWFWGAGKPVNTKNQVSNLYFPKESELSSKYEYFAKAAKSTLQTIPEDTNKLLLDKDENKSSQVLFLDQLILPAFNDNFDEFQSHVTSIDNQIIKPLLQAWKANKIDIEINCCDGTLFKPKHPSFYKFWLKPKKLRDLVDETHS